MTPLRRFLLAPFLLGLLAMSTTGPRAAAFGVLPVSGSETGDALSAEALGQPALPRFSLFGWVSPPRALTTTARYAEMANAGFNVTVLAWDETGTEADNRTRLAVTDGLGMHDLLLDNRLDSVFTSRPASMAIADSIVNAYKAHPSFLGYYLGDEPKSSDFARLGEWFSVLRGRDPSHPGWNSISGRMAFLNHSDYEEYTRGYVAATHPAVLCNSTYDFRSDGDLHLLTENVSLLAQVARDNGIPFWGIVLQVQHGVYRQETAGMLRWQAAQWLAYGARGIGWFTYWTPAPDPWYSWQPAMIAWGTGARTANYDTIRAINLHIAPIGNTLAGARWVATEHAGSVPAWGTPFRANTVLSAVTGRATIGFFSDSTGAPLVFVANADSLGSQTVTLKLTSRRRVWRLRDDGSAWDERSLSYDNVVPLTLAPGDCTLLRMSGGVGTTVADVGEGRPGTLRLDFSPNPARGEVHFALAGVLGAARLEVMDVGGRRVWATDCAAGATGARWRGEDERGGRAAAGVYLARLASSGRTVVRRVAWLGAN